jgi:hypothetical protein
MVRPRSTNICTITILFKDKSRNLYYKQVHHNLKAWTFATPKTNAGTFTTTSKASCLACAL